MTLCHISPHKLHHENEEANEERACKELQVSLQDKYVEFLYKPHVRACKSVCKGTKITFVEEIFGLLFACFRKRLYLCSAIHKDGGIAQLVRASDS